MERNLQPEDGIPTSSGEFEFLQHSSSTTDSTTVTTVGRDSASETPLAGGSSTTSVHAVFNLDTKKVMDAIKETREILEKTSSKQPQQSSKAKPKKPKKKVSASWTAEWSEDAYEKNEPKYSGNY